MSKTFYIIYEGRGNGCHYTIGCNKTFEIMEADNVEEVVEAIEDEFTEYHARYAEDTYETISIVEAADVEQFDIKEYTARALAEEADKKAKQQQARELAELERLKKKYEQ